MTFADISSIKELEQTLKTQQAQLEAPATTPRTSSPRFVSRWWCWTASCGSFPPAILFMTLFA